MSIKPKVVVFNMTARSGKDVAVKFLMEKFANKEPKHLSFKDKLIATTLNFFGVSEEDWLARYDLKASKDEFICYGYEWKKDVPWLRLQIGDKCLSQREALIFVSEKVIKPVFGKSAFGNAVAKELEFGGLYFVSDGGFDEEQIPLLDKADVLFLKRDRLKSNWEGDSRGWISEWLGGSHEWVPDTIQDQDEYLEYVQMVVGEWIGLVDEGFYENQPF